jgi:hypothetical protein
VPAFAHPNDRLSSGFPRSSRTRRAFATITSCPNPFSKRLIHGECVPVSSAIRQRGIAPKTSCNAFAFVRTRCSSRICPASSTMQYQLLRSPRSSPMVSLGSEIFLLCCAATVLIFFIAGLLYLLCFEHVDNLGAYSIPSETGLLIPSVNDNFANATYTCCEPMQIISLTFDDGLRCQMERGVAILDQHVWATKLHDFQRSKQAVFPPPPQPDYWFRLDFNSENSTSVALK